LFVRTLVRTAIAPILDPSIKREHGMKVFVTGAAGFIGGSIAAGLIKAGHQVVGLVRNPDQVAEVAKIGVTGIVGTLGDHDLLVARYPGVRSVRFRAALELPFLQRCLAALARLRGLGVPLPMQALAAAFARAGRWFDRFGSDLGGMSVQLRGHNDGRPHALCWELTAPTLHGPEIPCLAAILLVRKLAAGAALPVGAHACMGLLSLAEFEGEFAAWRIETAVREI